MCDANICWVINGIESRKLQVVSLQAAIDWMLSLCFKTYNVAAVYVSGLPNLVLLLKSFWIMLEHYVCFKSRS